MSKYITSPTMLHDKFSDKVVQPDLRMVETLHKLLDMVPNRQVAFAIVLCVADLIRFHNPRDIAQASLANQEIIEPALTSQEATKNAERKE